jgi:hypothetical protein
MRGFRRPLPEQPVSNESLDSREKEKRMFYFVVATLHFYRPDINKEFERDMIETFLEKNSAVIERVREEARLLFNYELSQDLLFKAVNSFLYPGRSITNTVPFGTEQPAFPAYMAW